MALATFLGVRLFEPWESLWFITGALVFWFLVYLTGKGVAWVLRGFTGD